MTKTKDNNSINTNLAQRLPRQPLGPPLKAKKLNLCRFASFSALKFSGLNVSGLGYSCGQRCVTYGDTNTLEPFGSSKFAVERKKTKKERIKINEKRHLRYSHYYANVVLSHAFYIIQQQQQCDNAFIDFV